MYPARRRYTGIDRKSDTTETLTEQPSANRNAEGPVGSRAATPLDISPDSGSRTDREVEPRRRGGLLHSLWVRLLILVLLILVPVAVLVLHLTGDWRQAAVDDAGVDVARLATVAATSQENLLDSTRLLLGALAVTDEVLAALGQQGGGAVCSEYLARLHDGMPQFGVLVVADSAGAVRCSSLASDTPVHVSDRPYFLQAMASGLPSIGDYQIGRFSGRPTIPLAHPLLADGGGFGGVVVASIDLSRPGLLADRLDLPEGSVVEVFDHDGIVLMRWPVSDGFVGRIDSSAITDLEAGETAEAVGLDGVKRFYGAAALTDEDGSHILTVGIPTAAVLVDASETAAVSWWWLIALTLVAGGGALLFGRISIVSPIRHLEAIAGQLATGDLTVRSRAHGPTEIVSLGFEFDAMAQSLQRREDELRAAERRAVEERYRGLLDIAADAILVVDGEGKVLVSNAGAGLLFEVDPTEVAGNHTDDLLVGLAPEAGTDRREICWADGTGAVRWIEATYSSPGDDNTTIVIRETTARHHHDAAVNALAASEERFRLTQENSAIGLALVGLDGHWLEVNPALCHIVGRTAEELLALTFQEITHPDDLDADLDFLQRLVDDEIESYRMDKRYLHGDGHEVWVQLDVSAARNSDRTALYVVAQVQDVTERKRSQQLVDLLFHSSPDLLALIDTDGYFIRINPAWTETFGWSEQEMLGRTFLELVHPDDYRRTAHESANVAAGRPAVAFENRVRASDGGYRDLQWNSVFLDWSGLTVANARDVTAQRAQAGALEEYRKLVDRQKLAQFEETIRVKDQFLASIAHEIRTPLTAVIGLSEILRSGDFARDEVLEFSSTIASQAQEVGYIVEDLLIAGRLESRNLVIKPNQIDLVHEVNTVLRNRSGEPGIDFDPDSGPAAAFADGLRVRQILRNLTSNAVRYGRSPIRVDFGHGDGRIVVRVTDEGDGIPEEAEHRMFQPYATFAPSVGQPDSVGLGLHVARRLARLMDGDLTYRRDGDTTIFELDLPTQSATG